MFLWRRLFPVLQQRIPAHRSAKLLAVLDKAATVYHSMYENSNYDCQHNGEGTLLKRLHEMGNLEVVFDVGANVGDYAQLARSISPTCKIFAFEPVAATYQKLASANIGGDITLVNSALGEQIGPTEISVPEDSTLASLLLEEQIAVPRKTRRETINVTRGDAFLSTPDAPSTISLIKVDTEGFEPWVLKGFGDKLKSAAVVQFEYGKANLFAKYFLHDYFRDYAHDFTIGKLYPKGAEFYDEYHWDLDDLIGPNYVMVRKDRPDIVSALRI